jgi:hypothetical protein
MYISAEPPESRRARVVPWAIAIMSLVISAGLVGALVARQGIAAEAPPPAAQEAAPTATPVASAVAPAAPPVAAPDPVSNATSSLAVIPTPRTIVRVATPSRRAVVEAPAGHSAPVAASPGPAPASPVTASPKTDCDPPFYFEGTKKVFKPSCI